MAEDFDAKEALKKVQEENDGIKFDNKVKESIRRSTDVQIEVRNVVWQLLKEKIVWVVLGAFSFAAFELLKELLSTLISKI